MKINTHKRERERDIKSPHHPHRETDPKIYFPTAPSIFFNYFNVLRLSSAIT
jgi:hypothetical protein